MANEKFSNEIAEILSTVFGCAPGNIELTHYEYINLRKQIPDAPEVDDLTPADVPGVYLIWNYDHTNKETWKAFVERVTKKETERDEDSDPFMPNWKSKTEDRPNPWAADTGTMIATAYKEAFARAFRAVKPMSNSAGLFDLVGMAPTEDEGALMDVANSLEHVSNYLIDGMGESQDDNIQEFRWSRSLVMLGGLGIGVVRHFAKYIQDIESDWSHWANCSDRELREGIIEARRISCYPVSLLRADYRDLQTICADGQLSPRWMKASLACHLFKHVRYVPRFKGDPAMWYAFRGEHGYVPFDPAGLKQSLNDLVNAKMKQAICSHLGIRQERGRGRLDIDDVIDEVLAKIHPTHFAQPRELKTMPQIIVPRKVRMTPSHELRSDFKWFNPGIAISGAAEIDMDNGDVRPTVLAGATAMSMKWPTEDDEWEEADYKTWWSNLPKKVTPMLPSQILKPLFRNINTLGHDAGYWALIDATIIASLMRSELAGSPIGNAMTREFPLMIMYPTGHTKETTTNQGKTNYARTIAEIFAQGVPITPSSRTSSAPAQRVAAAPIEEFGTAIYDEFQLPSSHEHFLAQAGLQAMSTGGRGGPGRAGENSKGVRLKYPLLFTCKISAFPPDIRNRSIPTFMDILTEESRCNSEELSKITSGIVSNTVRLSTLMWIRQNQFIEKASEAGLLQGKLRFDGHMTLASMLCSNVKDINDYLLAAEAQCNEQQFAADESGLADDIGLNAQFDGAWFFKQCTEGTLKILADMTEEDQVFCLPAMRMIIEDGTLRRFVDVVRQYGGKERSLVLKFSDAIKEGRMHRPDGWMMEWTHKGGGKAITGEGVRDEKVRVRDCVLVRNRNAVEKTNKKQPAPAKA